MSIFERVQTALSGLNVPVANQVYIPATGHNFPDLFLVFFLITAPPIQHADDGETLRRNYIQVTTYSRDGLISLPDVDGAMKTAGFSRAAKVQLPYNRETGHFGLAQDYTYIEEIDDDT